MVSLERILRWARRVGQQSLLGFASLTLVGGLLLGSDGANAQRRPPGPHVETSRGFEPKEEPSARLERERQSAAAHEVDRLARGATQDFRDEVSATKAVNALTDSQVRRLIRRSLERHTDGPVASFLEKNPGFRELGSILGKRDRAADGRRCAQFRTEFVAWIAERLLAYREQMVRGLDAAQKWKLDAFIAERRPGVEITFRLETDELVAWLKSRVDELAQLRAKYDAQLKFGAPGSGKTIDGIFKSIDEHEAPYFSQAHRAFIKRFPILERLQIEGWNLDAVSLHDLERVLWKLQAPLPGGRPELIFALDPSSPIEGAAMKAMTEAWGDRTANQEIKVLEHDDVDFFMQGYAKRTVILVGHIDGASFMFSNGRKGRGYAIRMDSLIEAAEKYGVFIIPIGCSSSGTAAAYGFLRKIEVSEVVRFINALPRNDATVGDMFSALGKIAPINVKGAALADHLEAVFGTPSKADGDAMAEWWFPHPPSDRKAWVKVPIEHMRTWEAGRPMSFYAQPMNQLASDIRPWTDSGPLHAWRESYRSWRSLTLAVSAVTIFCLAYVVRRIEKNMITPLKGPQPALELLRTTLLTLGVFVAIWAFGSGLVYWFSVSPLGTVLTIAFVIMAFGNGQERT